MRSEQSTRGNRNGWTQTLKNCHAKNTKYLKNTKKHGYKTEDKEILDRLRNECQEAIVNAKESYLKNLGSKLADPTTGQKSYWKILNKFLNKCKIPKIPPLLVDDKYITNCKEKASFFNDFFSSQCTPIVNNSVLPDIRFHTTSRLSCFQISLAEISAIITGLNVKKAHGPDLISANMVKLCGEHLSVPLKIIFENILTSGRRQM